MIFDSSHGKLIHTNSGPFTKTDKETLKIYFDKFFRNRVEQKLKKNEWIFQKSVSQAGKLEL